HHPSLGRRQGEGGRGPRPRRGVGRGHRRRQGSRRLRRGPRHPGDAGAGRGAGRQTGGGPAGERRVQGGSEDPKVSIRVLIVDDQTLVRAGLSQLIRRTEDMEVVGEVADGRAAVTEGRRLRPDVVLMDIRMPEMDGIEATRRIVADPGLSDTRVIMLTTFDDDELIFESLKVGAAGFLLKDVEPDDLRKAIRVVAAGDALLAPAVTRRLLETFADSLNTGRAELLDGLTEREKEILVLVAEGMSNSEIAEELYLSPATVKTHVNRTMTKLGVHDRAGLVIAAYESGLVKPGG